MSLWSKATLLIIAAAALMLLSCAVSAFLVKDGDPGTIGACLAEKDGSAAILPGVGVTWRGSSGQSFGIKEWFEK